MEENEEVKDPQALLKAYRELQADIVALRSEKKELETKLESTDEEAVAKWRNRAVQAEAKNNLENQGIKNADRILKYLDLKDVDVDDNGGLVGFDDKLKTIKTDFPELFDAKRRAGNADIFADNNVETKMTGTEAQVARIFSKK